MGGELKPHTVIKTMYGSRVHVVRKLGGGGQGDVYQVIYGGEQKALKWYHVEKINDLSSFVANLRRNMLEGRPTPDFLWPIDMTEYYEGAFGYVMDLKPSGYEEAKEYLLGNVQFASYRRRIDACLRIVSAFRILHDKGFSYQDINAGNFFIEPSEGRVLICDNDNVSINGRSTGVLGTLSYMAPEIVLRKNLPNKYSDRHSLAVLLFRMLLGPHPLEGSRSANTVLDNETRRLLFGSEALFVMDPNDKSNAPDPHAQAGLVELWYQLPKHLRELFERAFSQDALHNPTMRPMETEWLKSLTRFRSEVITCSCGNDVCCEGGRSVVCDACCHTVRTPYVARFGNVTLPLARDMRIYECQLNNLSLQEATSIAVFVTGSLVDNHVLGIRNMTDKPWLVRLPFGGSHNLYKDEVEQIQPGLMIEIPTPIGTRTVRIQRNLS